LAKRRTVQNYLSDLPTEPESSLPLNVIVIPESQPRRYFDVDKIEQLADSIKEHGILEPLLVRPLPKQPNLYELVAGERRYRAATSLNLATVPVVIRELNDQQALSVALVENLAREDLNPVEEAEGILILLSIELGLERQEVTTLLYRLENEQKGKTTRNVMGSEVGQQVQALFAGLGQNWLSFTSNRLPLLNLPEDVLEVLRTGKLAYTKAKAIAKVKEEVTRKNLLEDAIAHNLSLSQIRERIKERQSSPQTSKPQKIVETTAKRIKSAKLWESDPKKWNKVQSLLAEIDKLIEG
jgi:ParB family chromosome partitioning protein